MSGPASYMCYLRYRRWIDRAFVRGVRPAQWRKLSAHLRDCTPCRARYDRLGHVSQALSPSSALPVDVIERIGARLAADATGAAAAPRRPWGWLGVATGAAMASAALLLLFGPRGTSPTASRDLTKPEATGETGALRPRGQLDAAGGLVPGERQPGARVFCIGATGPDAQVVSETRATVPAITAEPLRCDIRDELQIAYSTPDLPGIRMVAFGRDDAGRTYWYAPRFAHEPAVALHADTIDEPLDWITRLQVRHNPGTYVLHVLFFDRAVAADAAAAGMIEPIYELHGLVEITGVSTEEP